LITAVFRQSEAKIKAPFKSSPTLDAIFSADAIPSPQTAAREAEKRSYHDALQDGTTVGRVLGDL
jgi:hypothetical protein